MNITPISINISDFWPRKEETIAILRGEVLLHYDDIVRLEGDGNYTRFILTNGRRILVAVCLCFYEKALPNLFVRVHKQHIVNRRHIEVFNKKYVIMGNGGRVAIARRKQKQIQAILSSITYAK
ncbi:MAG: LytTR family DNA-binding domain-containing protein [Spirosomataceae bacterium]